MPRAPIAEKKLKPALIGAGVDRPTTCSSHPLSKTTRQNPQIALYPPSYKLLVALLLHVSVVAVQRIV
jgi:hypothetical protein